MALLPGFPDELLAEVPNSNHEGNPEQETDDLAQELEGLVEDAEEVVHAAEEDEQADSEGRPGKALVLLLEVLAESPTDEDCQEKNDPRLEHVAFLLCGIELFM